MPDPSRLSMTPEFIVIAESARAAEAARGAIKAIFPEAKVFPGVGTLSEPSVSSVRIEVAVAWDKGLVVEGTITGGHAQQCTLTEVDQEILEPIYTDCEREQRVEERVRLLVHKLVAKALGVPVSPWGILVGVRPTKIVHRYMDRGFDERRIVGILRNVYGIAPNKIQLLLEVVRRQRAFLHPNGTDGLPPISIYVGIPFCPSRCRYCSFAAYPVRSHGHLIPSFLRALVKELHAVGRVVKTYGLPVDSWYIGGGTPTVLTSEQLDVLLQTMHEALPAPLFGEFTVEAGRPDTITRDKLVVLKDQGVNRLSINPQTMQQKTLDAIGRQHSVAQVMEAFRLARDVGFTTINADLIIGLPGEDLQDVTDTLAQVALLAPENLTIHGLAVKRAATWRQDAASLDYPDSLTAAQMVELTRRYAADHGLVPYYLYRQRYIVGDLENVGYALPGTESIYNIQMMEERQTVLAFGGGGISKLVDTSDFSLVRLPNPKCPGTYVHRLESLILNKQSALKDWVQGQKLYERKT